MHLQSFGKVHFQMKILMTKLVDTVQLKGVLYLLMTYTQCSQGNHKISDSDNTDDIVTHDDKQT